MDKSKIWAGISFLLSGIVWFFREAIKDMFFGWFGNKILPASGEGDMNWIWGFIFEYGVPIILISVGLGVLFWNYRRSIYKPSEEEQAFYNAQLKPAGESGSQVLRRVLLAIRNHADEAVSGQEGLIQRSVVDPERQALAMLNNALSGQISINDAEQLQDYIADYYRAYQGMRTWIEQGGKMAGFAFNSDIIFQEWLRLDEQFLNALRQFTGPPRYDHLRGKVGGVGWGENITNSLRGLANNG